MATAFFGGNFFGGEFFSTSAIKTGTGGIDPAQKLARGIIKPTGLLHLPKAKDPAVQKRLEDSVELHRETAREAAKEFFAVPEIKSIEKMSMDLIEAEIGVLLRKELRTQEDELLMLMLIAASS